jgi:tRNA (adenine22-N1)-methyltransferase
MKISKRLQKIAEWVPAGSAVADIGSDHALVPLYLVTNGISDRVIAGEVNEGPFQTARANVARMGLQEQIDVRKGDGLRVIQPGEVSVIILAGMGGGTILEILSEGREKLSGVKRLILQPQGDIAQVRVWLGQNGWVIRDEDLMEEEGLLYEILVAERGSPAALTMEEEEFGPILLRQGHPLLPLKLQQEIERAERVLKSLAESGSEMAAQKRREWENRWRWLREVMERVSNRQENDRHH